MPHGVYTGPQDYDQHFVRQSIVDRRLAPFCKGSDDDDTYADRKFNSECPICFLNYPTPLNFSRCCHQPICTECFVQMKRADPNSHNPPSSEPRSCPFCVEPDSASHLHSGGVGARTTLEQQRQWKRQSQRRYRCRQLCRNGHRHRWCGSV